MKNYLIIFYFPLRYSFGENCTFVGPGHGSVVSLKNEDWFVYHAWAYKKIGHEYPGRMLMLGKLTRILCKDSRKGSSEFHIGSNFIVFSVLVYKMEYF